MLLCDIVLALSVYPKIDANVGSDWNFFDDFIFISAHETVLAQAAFPLHKSKGTVDRRSGDIIGSVSLASLALDFLTHGEISGTTFHFWS